MRLLHTKDLRVQYFVPSKVPSKYAILSHTWEEGEVTLQDMEKGVHQGMKGYPKLKNSCKRAADDGYEWIWIDTCCIDKTSSAELTEAINSMFEYYNHSAVCYAYLADIDSLDTLEQSRWFTRGWTLQELLAPRVVIFFDSQWRKLGTKHGSENSLSKQIASRTGIPEDVIQGRLVQTCNVAQRMSWAAQRELTREEDSAYCLLGLFDIHMTVIYGEGAEKAFLRLQEEIIRQSADHTLFIWTPKHDPYNQGLLARESPTKPRSRSSRLTKEPAELGSPQSKM
ncbi:HET-domain-containing protein [Aulographum hederae CBS 113979]|uniref:HET-domain-containing protein n=1 Tax=Aulographum hederae CBS 113979 TaxID=1176131 RepID=A0A6G1GSU9_9PEZI|nr:HET-domain-containing protein [Aulographum hederae CBS 113979]